MVADTGQGSVGSEMAWAVDTVVTVADVGATIVDKVHLAKGDHLVVVE